MAPASAVGARVQIGVLSVAGRIDQPLGVDDGMPRLAWQLDRGVQRSYHVRAASSADLLATPDLWEAQS